MLSTLVNIIAAPRLAYQRLLEAPGVLFPIALLLVAVSLTTFTYFQLSDPDLLIDDLLAQASEGMSEAELGEAREGMKSMPSGALKWLSTISGSLGMLYIFIVHAGYYYLISMFNGTKISYKPWLSFVAWSNIPALFATIASLATLLLATGHTSVLDLNPFTFINLLGIESSNNWVPSALKNLDITRIWSFALMLVGYRVWTEKPWIHCGLVVLLPLVAVYGAMIAFGS